MLVKVFKAYKADDSRNLENKMNAFLKNPGINILEIHTSVVDTFLFVIIEYEVEPDDEF